MKTEAEVRKYRDALVFASQQGCNCVEQGCDALCQAGACLMQIEIATLSWIVDGDDRFDRKVEHYLAWAARQGVRR